MSGDVLLGGLQGRLGEAAWIIAIYLIDDIHAFKPVCTSQSHAFHLIVAISSLRSLASLCQGHVMWPDSASRVPSGLLWSRPHPSRFAPLPSLVPVSGDSIPPDSTRPGVCTQAGPPQPPNDPSSSSSFSVHRRPTLHLLLLSKTPTYSDQFMTKSSELGPAQVEITRRDDRASRRPFVIASQVKRSLR